MNKENLMDNLLELCLYLSENDTDNCTLTLEVNNKKLTCYIEFSLEENEVKNE